MRISSCSTFLAAATGCLFITTCTNSLAVILSNEPFSAAPYTVGTELPTLNPTVPGYTGPWVDVDFGTAEPAVAAGSLVYGGAGYAAGAGNKIGKAADAAGIQGGNSGRTYRLLDNSLLVSGTTSGVRYLSALFQTGNENVADQPDIYSVIQLGDAGTQDPDRELYFGLASEEFNLDSTDYGFMVDNNQALRTDFGVARDANVHLFVFKFNLTSTGVNDTITGWLDPVLGAGEPAGGITFGPIDLTFDRLIVSDYASNSSYWDEIRWGDTFNSVTTESALPPILGDYNQDRFVDAADFTFWRDRLDQAADALPNRNPLNEGNINPADYEYWKLRFGAVSGTGSISGAGCGALDGGGSVPEPGTLLLGLLALGGLCGRRGKSSNRSHI